MPGRVAVSSTPLDALTSNEVVVRVLDALDEGRGGLLVTPNVDILRLLRSPDLAPIAHRADLVVCDGVPVLWACWLAGTPLPERVTGSDLIWSLSGAATTRRRSVYIIGGPPGAAEAALLRLSARFPGLPVAGWAVPEHGFHRDPEAVEALAVQVAAAAPDIVYVCLGFPKQEQLALALAVRSPRSWFVGCGAAVEFVAGTRRRAPRWLQRRGLEWVHRLVQEPRRLGPRYAKDAVFAAGLLTSSLVIGVRRRTAAVVARSGTRPVVPSGAGELQPSGPSGPAAAGRSGRTRGHLIDLTAVQDVALARPAQPSNSQPRYGEST